MLSEAHVPAGPDVAGARHLRTACWSVLFAAGPNHRKDNHDAKSDHCQASVGRRELQTAKFEALLAAYSEKKEYEARDDKDVSVRREVAAALDKIGVADERDVPAPTPP